MKHDLETIRNVVLAVGVYIALFMIGIGAALALSSQKSK